MAHIGGIKCNAILIKVAFCAGFRNFAINLQQFRLICIKAYINSKYKDVRLSYIHFGLPPKASISLAIGIIFDLAGASSQPTMAKKM